MFYVETTGVEWAPTFTHCAKCHSGKGKDFQGRKTVYVKAHCARLKAQGQTCTEVATGTCMDCGASVEAPMKLTPTAMGSVAQKRNDSWGTPQALFNWLDNFYEFDFDVCADVINHKMPQYWTIEDDALSMDWKAHGDNFFMNPPYSRVADFMDKAWAESLKDCTVVSLVPNSSETQWWTTAFNRALGTDGEPVKKGWVLDHKERNWIVLAGKYGEAWFSPYRIQFIDPEPGRDSSNPKGSTIFVFYGTSAEHHTR